MKSSRLESLIAVITTFVLCRTAFASSAGMPWEGPLSTVVRSLTGPVAKAIGVAAIVIACALAQRHGDVGGADDEDLPPHHVRPRHHVHGVDLRAPVPRILGWPGSLSAKAPIKIGTVPGQRIRSADPSIPDRADPRRRPASAVRDPPVDTGHGDRPRPLPDLVPTCRPRPSRIAFASAHAEGSALASRSSAARCCAQSSPRSDEEAPR